MITVQELRNQIKTTLTPMGLYSPAVEELLVGTAIQESRLQYTTQLGNGPALGYFQMEPATHDDCWNSYICFRKELDQKIRSAIPGLSGKIPSATLLKTNVPYMIIMARVRYMRVSEPIPDAHNLSAQAMYWKNHYNTPLGAGTATEFITHYKQIVK